MSEEQAQIEAELDEYVEDSDRIADLKATVSRLTTQLRKARISKEDLVAAVYQAAKDNVIALDIAPVPDYAPDARSHGEEVAVAVIGDWQLAKVTPDYNSQVCAERVDLYADKVLKLTDIQRSDHPVKKLRIWALGDLVEGELIFPGQGHLIDASLYEQVCKTGVKIGQDFLRRMESHFEEVTVEAVIGNHGRIGGKASRDMDPESNADRMLYRIWQLVSEASGSKTKFLIPDGGREKNWYHVADVGGYRTLLFHGDQIKGGFGGFPWYGFGKKLNGWKNGAIPGGFDDSFCGHWHQPTKFCLNQITHRVVGSTESFNTYAQESLAAVGRASQHVQFVKPGVGVTAEYTVYLDDTYNGVPTHLVEQPDPTIVDFLSKLTPEQRDIIAEIAAERAA
jgi:hypothetical protein